VELLGMPRVGWTESVPASRCSLTGRGSVHIMNSFL